MKFIIFLLFPLVIQASTSEIMNKALESLLKLLPYMSHQAKFLEKKNHQLISNELDYLQIYFKQGKHEKLLTKELFAPTLLSIEENLKTSSLAFKGGAKDYAHWRLREITTQCLDCHSKLPENHPSSFQLRTKALNEKQFDDPYYLGLAQMIVRQYDRAHKTFEKDIELKLKNNKTENLDKEIKQLLVINVKIRNKVQDIEKAFKKYLKSPNLPNELKNDLLTYLPRLNYWKHEVKFLPKTENTQEIKNYIKKYLEPIFNDDGSYLGKFDIDLLMSSGVLSHHLFYQPESNLTPEITFWMGRIEKFLQRQNFLGTGDLYFKECIYRFASHPIAQKCYKEFEESMIFEFTGSSGTNLPKDIKRELEQLKAKLKKTPISKEKKK